MGKLAHLAPIRAIYRGIYSGKSDSYCKVAWLLHPGLWSPPSKYCTFNQLRALSCARNLSQSQGSRGVYDQVREPSTSNFIVLDEHELVQFLQRPTRYHLDRITHFNYGATFSGGAPQLFPFVELPERKCWSKRILPRSSSVLSDWGWPGS